MIPANSSTTDPAKRAASIASSRRVASSGLSTLRPDSRLSASRSRACRRRRSLARFAITPEIWRTARPRSGSNLDDLRDDSRNHVAATRSCTCSGESHRRTANVTVLATWRLYRASRASGSVLDQGQQVFIGHQVDVTDLAHTLYPSAEGICNRPSLVTPDPDSASRPDTARWYAAPPRPRGLPDPAEIVSPCVRRRWEPPSRRRR